MKKIRIPWRILLRLVATTVGAFILVGLFAGITFSTSFLSPVARALDDFSMTDIYYQILQETGKPVTSQAVTLVDMTNLSARKDIAHAIDQIEACQPKALGVDIVFEGLKEDPEDNERIIDVAEMYPNVVYSYRLLNQDPPAEGYEEIHSFFTPFMDVDEGFTNFDRKLYGGLKRELSIGRKLGGEVKPSFALEVARAYAEQDVVPLSEHKLKINFSPTAFQTVSYDAVDQHKELLNGRIVLLGATKEESDMHYTPVGKMPGVKLLAYAIQTLLEQKEVRPLPVGWLVVVTFLVVLLTELWLSNYNAWAGGRRNRFLQFFLSMRLTICLLTFIWMGLLLWTGFAVFSLLHYSVNFGWAFAAIPLLTVARQFYDTCQESYNDRHK